MTVLDVQNFKLPSELFGKETVFEALAQIAHNQNMRSFNQVQESLLQLAQKIQQDIVLTADEVQFIEALFLCPWWGGESFGFNEALHFKFENRPESAKIVPQKEKNIEDQKQLHVVQLHQHFVHGDGQLLAVNLPIFKSSIIVQDCIVALKKHIIELVKNNKPATKISTQDNQFLKSPFALEIESVRREVDHLGYIFNDGTLMLEQKEAGLRNFENRFAIEVMSTKMGSKINSRWRVKGSFNVPNFNSTDYVFHLPLNSSMSLKIPAGIFSYLVKIERAKPFVYFADWAEMYAL